MSISRLRSLNLVPKAMQGLENRQTGCERSSGAASGRAPGGLTPPPPPAGTRKYKTTPSQQGDLRGSWGSTCLVSWTLCRGPEAVQQESHRCVLCIEECMYLEGSQLLYRVCSQCNEAWYLQQPDGSANKRQGEKGGRARIARLPDDPGGRVWIPTLWLPRKAIKEAWNHQ